MVNFSNVCVFLSSQNFEQLIHTVEDTGGVMREIKDLEEQVSLV